MKIFLPYRGEFGWIVMNHAPQVFACRSRKIVCCEVGNEALYPGAVQYVHVERRLDQDRRARREEDLLVETERRLRAEFGDGCELVRPDHDAPREYFIPQPLARYGIACDVVVCPRRRAYGADKNWSHWQALIDGLQALGLRVFAAGAPDSSFDVACSAGRAWDRPRFLDATIEAMWTARLVIATDSGLAHLAVLCGRPLLLISHGDGLVAAGVDDTGRPYWPIMIDRFGRENHRGAPIDVVRHAWFDPVPVLAEVN